MPVNNHFIIHDPDNEIASATLRLCGKEVDLTRRGHQVRGTLPISCEGSGDILVELKDDGSTSCPVGYVTSGLEITFDYEIVDGKCLGKPISVESGY